MNQSMLTSSSAGSTLRPRASTAADLHKRTRALYRPRVELANVGWICVIAAGVLTLLGVLAIGTVAPGYAMRHLVHTAVGMVAAAVVAAPHYRWLQRLSYPLLIAVIAMLIFVLIPVVPEWLVEPRKGARRWISVGITDFQPSELAKFAYILALACYLRYRSNYRYFGGLLLPLILTFIPVGLIVVEPDLGTAMLFLPTFFAMMIAAGAKIKHVIAIILLGLSIAPAMYPLLEPHQKDRIQAMIAQIEGNERYTSGIGFQGAQAMTLVGSGQITGAGKQHAADLVKFNALPEDHNDMIFAVICSRWGLLGALATWGLFMILTIGGLLVAGLSKDPFGRLVAVGIVAMIFAQMVVNTGMTIGLLPITGLTLPFVSAGGSSLVATWLMIGLLLNIGMRRPQYLARQSFEFDGSTDEA